MDLLRQKWWKFLCIPLLFYSFAAGISTPLAPGVASVSPMTTKRGTMVNLDIQCYNTHFTKDSEEDGSLSIVLKNDNNLLCASAVTVISPTLINVEFGISPDLRTVNKKDYYNLFINNPQDGTFSMRDAFSIEREDTAKGVGMLCATNMESVPPTGMVFPHREILYETIRNLFFHVPMWFTMILLMLIAFINGILYLSKGKREYDIISSSAAGVGLFFGTLGILTGMLWANFTWGAPWVNDPKLNGAALGMLVYLAYFVLRGSLNNEESRAKVSAVYSVFAFVIFIVFIWVVPRITDSLHPGSGGNPGFKTYDLDSVMRPVFYSAVLGFMILGCWMVALVARYRNLLNIQLEKE